MQIKINDLTFEVDMSPLEARAREQIEKLIADRSGGIGVDALRMLVKQGCNMALPLLGIEKQSRNDDPIALVIDKLILTLLEGLEKNGLALTGQRIDITSEAKEETVSEQTV